MMFRATKRSKRRRRKKKDLTEKKIKRNENHTHRTTFTTVKVWNNLNESIKDLPLKSFKNKVKLTSHNHIANIHEFSSGAH